MPKSFETMWRKKMCDSAIKCFPSQDIKREINVLGNIFGQIHILEVEANRICIYHILESIKSYKLHFCYHC